MPIGKKFKHRIATQPKHGPLRGGESACPTLHRRLTSRRKNPLLLMQCSDPSIVGAVGFPPTAIRM